MLMLHRLPVLAVYDLPSALHPPSEMSLEIPFIESSFLFYATYHEGRIAEICEFTREEWDAPHQSTLTVLTKDVFKDPYICKT
ncbi:hypothetical protein Tco_0521712, partial [Tanacetum coccineum]